MLRIFYLNTVTNIKLMPFIGTVVMSQTPFKEIKGLKKHSKPKAFILNPLMPAVC